MEITCVLTRVVEDFHSKLVLNLVFFVVLGAITLTHTFAAPNGLGVFGGKAKLFFLAGRIPEGFFTAKCWDTLQPAYPPGWALITLGGYGMAGFCGEYWTQLLGCAALAAVFAFLCGRTEGWAAIPWIAAFFLTTNTIQLGTYYYAEPIMALFALVGWERMRRGNGDMWGWLLLGAAGWFKNEGILILPTCWVAARLLMGKKSAPCLGLLAGLALPLAWHAGCRLAGGGLYDFAPVWQPDRQQAIAALGKVWRLAFAEPWRFGFVWPLAVLCGLAPRMRTRSFVAANMAALLITAAFVAIFSLSRAGDFEWHLNSMERLLWLPALLLMREFLKYTSDKYSIFSRH